MTSIDQLYCKTLDQNDPLAALREEFNLPAGMIYLDGNSLGAQPKVAFQRAQQVIQEEWGNDLIKSWNKAGWFDLPSRLGNLLAPLIGADADEVVVTDSTSINLFKAIAAALNIQSKKADANTRKVIVTERSNFPTDIYMAEGLTQWLDRGYRLHLIDSAEELSKAINQDTALVMLTHVNYRSGALHDMAAVTAMTHAHGALCLWDLAHSAGAVEVNLQQANADFAVGCCYKYLNGGPGAPAFIWVPKRHQAEFHHPLTGWWGHAAPFAMHPSFTVTPDIRRALCGTQPIVSLAMIESGLQVFAKTSMASVRQKSLALTDLFIQLVETRCAQHQLELVTPREHAQRGSHVSFTHQHAYAVIQALIERGVVGDYREPGIMRFGFTPLYTSYTDVWNAVEILRDILDSRSYNTNIQRNAVT
ncbi:kynureninase [Undibacterium macrobrachii]|uniref:Kynureninase n=1 Tax=Undibacterium macrobrachii TaxID=1119058 RepID=A0ABQ2XMZ2_9BURK|nr:kynureninase [Undibacterium macrobrachii]GGX25005.1 kynureninase [Undibacterium macrobrachii]